MSFSGFTQQCGKTVKVSSRATVFFHPGLLITAMQRGKQWFNTNENIIMNITFLPLNPTLLDVKCWIYLSFALRHETHNSNYRKDMGWAELSCVSMLSLCASLASFQFHSVERECAKTLAPPSQPFLSDLLVR